MPSTPNYHAELEHGRLAELLYKLYRYRVPGVVEARSEDVVKRLFVKDGNVVYASSSDRRDSLGSFLLRHKLVPAESLKEVAKARTSGKKRFGVLLMERGLLSPAELHAAIRQQVEEVAWSLFGWDHGELDVDLGETAENNAIEIHIPMRSMILRGLRRTNDPKPLLHRIGGRSVILQTNAKAGDLVDIGIDAKEYQLLQSIDGERNLFEICHDGPFSPSDNAKVVYAFWVLQLVRQRPEGEAPPGKKIKLRTTGNI